MALATMKALAQPLSKSFLLSAPIVVATAGLLASACGDADLAVSPPPEPAPAPDPTPAPAPPAPPAPEPSSSSSTLVFRPEADLQDPEQFYDLPWPSDLRLTEDGAPDVRGLTGIADVPLLASVQQAALDRRGFPANPAAYFRFDGPLARQSVERVFPGAPDDPVLLMDIDPDSPERGRLHATIASTPPADFFVRDHLLAASVAPGIVLAPHRLYAFLVLRSLGNDRGEPLGRADGLAALGPGGDRAVDPVSAPLANLYAPLWPTLETRGIRADDVAAATVFTTGDVVADVALRTEQVRAAHPVEITDLEVDPDDGAVHERFCEIHGRAVLPQFQVGEPPFNESGHFATDGEGSLERQRLEEVPVTVTLPRRGMPVGGFPLVLYFHGSGGLSTQVVDRGPVVVEGGERTAGEGPAHVLAAHGIATFGSAHPLNPQRLPGAASREYLNFANLGAYPYTFQQGTFEQALLLDALSELEISPATVSSCTGLSLPRGESGFKVRTDTVGVQGQSMGAQYANMLGAVEPRAGAVAPTGSGGLWSLVVLATEFAPGVNTADVIGSLLGTEADVDILHPGLNLVETAFEPAETLVFANRLGRRPLMGHPARDVYQPVGQHDPGFPETIYDAMALASANRQAGDDLWPTMQQALALRELDGRDPYPVRENAASVGGTPRTGVVVQFAPDELLDGHHVFAQLDEVKHQYGCFFETFFRDGTATVPAPAPLGTECP